jgi:hypothetical protein
MFDVGMRRGFHKESKLLDQNVAASLTRNNIKENNIKFRFRNRGAFNQVLDVGKLCSFKSFNYILDIK